MTKSVSRKYRAFSINANPFPEFLVSFGAMLCFLKKSARSTLSQSLAYGKKLAIHCDFTSFSHMCSRAGLHAVRTKNQTSYERGSSWPYSCTLSLIFYSLQSSLENMPQLWSSPSSWPFLYGFLGNFSKRRMWLFGKPYNLLNYSQNVIIVYKHI